MVNWDRDVSGNLRIELPLVTVILLPHPHIPEYWGFQLNTSDGLEVFRSPAAGEIELAKRKALEKAAELCEEQAKTIRNGML